MTTEAYELPPVHIDRERMDKALAGPRYSFPQGLTAEQLCHCMDTLSNAINDAIQQERERWTRGAKISIPTETMEQEFAHYERRGILAERERAAGIADNMLGCEADQIAAAIRAG
jgi:hypothetical protein